MTKFTKEREREIRGLLSQLERSGASVREFAREQGVSAWTVYSWRKRFDRRAPGRRGPRADLVEIRPGGLRTTAIEIAFADASVRVAPGFDDGELIRVLRAVRSC
jgi:transposase-like protein